MGVLVKHAPLVTALDIGVMSIRKENAWNYVAVMNGFAAVQEDRVIILVNAAESKETIDLQQAEQEFTYSKDRLDKVKDEKEKVEAILAFKRARARYLVVKD